MIDRNNRALTGKIAVVTGAAHGIGRAIATRLATDGAAVAILDRDGDALGDVASSIRKMGRNALPVQADLTRLADVQHAFCEVRTHLGTTDILVNNVGQSAREAALEFWCSDPALWSFMIDISLMTTLLCSRQVVEEMRERRRGRIINISSEAALIGSPSATSYAAAKAGVIGFTRSLARELAPFQVAVNAIAPGYTRTRALDLLPEDVVAKAVAEIPLGFIGAPEDIAHAVAFFASDESRYVTGQTLLVNGGRWTN